MMENKNNLFDPLLTRKSYNRLEETKQTYNIQNIDINSSRQPEIKKPKISDEKESTKSIKLAKERYQEVNIEFDTESQLVLLLNAPKDVKGLSPEVEELLRFTDHNSFWMLLQNSTEIPAGETHCPLLQTETLYAKCITNVGNVLVLKKDVLQNVDSTRISSVVAGKPRQERRVNVGDNIRKKTETIGESKHVTSRAQKNGGGGLTGPQIDINMKDLTIQLNEKILTEDFYSSVRRLVHPDLSICNSKDTIKKKQKKCFYSWKPVTRSKCMQCCILVAGDADSLYILTQTLEKNIPVIVITNSGGLSDIICKPFPDKDTRSKDVALWKNASVVYKKYSNHIFELDKKDLINKDIVASVILKALRGSFVKEVNKENESTDTRLEAPFSDDKFAYILICIQLDKLEEAESDGILQSLFRDESNSNAEQKNLIQSKAINLDRSRFIQYLDEHYSLFETSKNGSKNVEALFKETLDEGRKEVCKILWRKVKHPTGAALYAYLHLQKLCADPNVSEEKKRVYSSMMSHFQSVSIETLNLNYRRDKDTIDGLMYYKMKEWDSKSCIELAIHSKNRQFLSQEPCIEFRKKILNLEAPFNLATLRSMGGDAVFQKEGILNTAGKKEKSKINKHVSLLDKLLSPFWLMWFDFIGLILFLFAFGVLLLSVLSAKSLHWLEVLTGLMFLPFLIELVNQEIRNKLTESKKKFNFRVLSLVAQIMFVLALILRIVAICSTDNSAWMSWARIMYSLDYVCFSLLLLEFCYQWPFMGPLLVMIKHMVIIFAKFSLIVLVIFIAYAVASESVLYPEAELSGKLIFYSLQKPFFAMFAEFSLNDFEAQESDEENHCTSQSSSYNDYTELRCPSYSGRFYAPILLGCFYIAVGVVLFNLLIALFGNEIKKLDEQSIQLWHLQNTYFVIKYFFFVCPPLPFTLLVFPLAWIQRQRDRLKPHYVGGFEVLTEHERIYINAVQEDSRKQYIESSRKKNQQIKIQCIVKCPHTDSSVFHEQQMLVPNNEERISEEAAVAVLRHQDIDIYGNDNFFNSDFRMKKPKKRKRYFAVRSKYKYGIRWQVVKVKPLEPEIGIEEDSFMANVRIVNSSRET